MSKISKAEINSVSLEELRDRSALATTYFSRMFSALTAITFREKGEGAVNRLWYRALSSHQNDRYEEGLKKLGIDGDPPAVAAAKYHFFTNLIAGLDMEYIEESSKKVRSEEHTSELQSRGHLVCRLLLEK